MPRVIPTLGYPTRQAAIEALHDDGLSVEEIAQKIGISQETVRVVLCHVRNGRRRCWHRVLTCTIVVPTTTLDRLRVDADARGVSVNKLVRLLLDHIVDDNMVNAVLDDEAA